jgi:transcriptional regulator with XRE-family HTH domain
MKYPNRIRYLRELQGISQVELASLVGTSQQYVSRFEKGDVQLDVEWMQKFSKALGVAPLELISSAALAGLEEHVEELNGHGYAAISAIAAQKRMHLYKVLTTAVEQAGVPKDAIIGVDAEREPRTGDVVLVEMAQAESHPEEGTCRMLWQFVEPGLLLTNRKGFNLVLSLDDAMLRAKILGVVIRSGDKPQ